MQFSKHVPYEIKMVHTFALYNFLLCDSRAVPSLVKPFLQREHKTCSSSP